MVRTLVKEAQDDGAFYMEFACLSDDDKPVYNNLATGSLCLEVNTGDVYAFDETSTGTWTKIAELAGDS